MLFASAMFASLLLLVQVALVICVLDCSLIMVVVWVFCVYFLSWKVLCCLVLSACMQGLWALGLSEDVSFKASLQRARGYRFRLPKAVRVQFGLDPCQVLLVMVCPLGASMSWETFYGRVYKSERITIPKLTLSLLQSHAGEQTCFSD